MPTWPRWEKNGWARQRISTNMAMLTLGTGVGGGLVLSGSIWHGMNGMAGEFGHTTVEPEGHPCQCGNRGCLEQYASATAIVRMAREKIARKCARSALARAAHADAEFSAKSIYNTRHSGRRGRAADFPARRPSFGIVLATLVNVTEPAHLRNWGRRIERVGGFLAIHLESCGSAQWYMQRRLTRPIRWRAIKARRRCGTSAAGSKRRCPGAPGRRCGIVRRRPSAMIVDHDRGIECIGEGTV